MFGNLLPAAQSCQIFHVVKESMPHFCVNKTFITRGFGALVPTAQAWNRKFLSAHVFHT